MDLALTWAPTRARNVVDVQRGYAKTVSPRAGRVPAGGPRRRGDARRSSRTRRHSLRVGRYDVGAPRGHGTHGEPLGSRSARAEAGAGDGMSASGDGAAESRGEAGANSDVDATTVSPRAGRVPARGPRRRRRRETLVPDPAPFTPRRPLRRRSSARARDSRRATGSALGTRGGWRRGRDERERRRRRRARPPSPARPATAPPSPAARPARRAAAGPRRSRADQRVPVKVTLVGRGPMPRSSSADHQPSRPSTWPSPSSSRSQAVPSRMARISTSASAKRATSWSAR
jgi:hypothetical protein